MGEAAKADSIIGADGKYTYVRVRAAWGWRVQLRHPCTPDPHPHTAGSSGDVRLRGGVKSVMCLLLLAAATTTTRYPQWNSSSLWPPNSLC